MEVNIKLSLLANQKQTPQGITGETPERAGMTDWYDYAGMTQQRTNKGETETGGERS